MPPMSKTVNVIVILSLVLCVGACRQGEVEQEPSGADVVILVTVDGLVPEELRIFGGEVDMPALERIAKRGRAWGDAWTAAPMTRPGAATYLTGVAPDRHRVRDDLFSVLADDRPTLATAFSDAGYHTAAFPDSSFLGADSGLLRGFDLVADPPVAVIDASRWHPSIRLPEEVAADFSSWLDTLSEDDRYFAWVHLSGPLVVQLWELSTEEGLSEQMKQKQARRKKDPGETPPGIEELDAAISSILARLEQRGDLERALIVVAGTQADATGGTDDLAGPGFSVGSSAIQVPVILGWSRAGEIRPRDQAVWAPDVPATLAHAGGFDLADDSEGISLLDTVPADRTILAWAWASLDQMGWRAQRTARSGEFVRVEGLEERTRHILDPEIEVPEAEAARLVEALGARAEPAAPAVPLDRVRPVLEARGLTLTPVPSEGRTFGDAARRRDVSRKLLAARGMIRNPIARQIGPLFEEARVLDVDNPGVLLDQGQMVTSRNPTRAARLLGHGLELYPTNPELLHWYAHAVWGESWQDAEEIIELILPYKPQDGDVLYDLACTRALAGNLDESEKLLRRAIDSGFRRFDHMESDPDMRNLRQSGQLSRVLMDYR